MSNLRGGCLNITRSCLSDLPVRRPKPCPITSLQTRLVLTASSGLPEKRLCGKCSSLYTRSAILVTNDSGPAHFASMTPIRVVTLFGPETPALFAARSPNAIALWAGIACSPCVNAYNNRQSVCRNNLCMQAITVDDVFKEVTGIYDSLKTTTFGN